MSDPLENVLPPNSDTLLTITHFGIMLYQARNLTQTLEVIGEATQLERLIDGTLADFSVAQFRKYASKITIPGDTDAPPLDAIFPGMEVVVQCALQLAFLTSGGATSVPNRPVVSGSLYHQGAYTFYRPELTMRIRSVETHFDEWKCVVGWTIDLEEV